MFQAAPRGEGEEAGTTSQEVAVRVAVRRCDDGASNGREAKVRPEARWAWRWAARETREEAQRSEVKSNKIMRSSTEKRRRKAGKKHYKMLNPVGFKCQKYGYIFTYFLYFQILFFKYYFCNGKKRVNISLWSAASIGNEKIKFRDNKLSCCTLLASINFCYFRKKIAAYSSLFY